MLRGLLQLTWLEIKIFLREPLGAIGTTLMPVAVFLIFGRVMGSTGRLRGESATAFLNSTLPVLASVFIALSAVTSLVAIIAIYPEVGYLKRRRSTRSHAAASTRVSANAPAVIYARQSGDEPDRTPFDRGAHWFRVNRITDRGNVLRTALPGRLAAGPCRSVRTGGWPSATPPAIPAAASPCPSPAEWRSPD